MKKIRHRITFTKIIVFLLLAGICISLYHLLPDWYGRWKTKETYQKLAEDFVKDDSENEEVKEKKKDWWSQDVKIEFEELKKVNEEIVGWIRFDDIKQIPINYPILYSGDSEKYLRSDIYGEYQIAGCIFLEGLNQPNFSDLYNIIYGHNMRDESMFGSLKKYKEEGFYEQNPYFTVYTEERAYRYQIFSWFEAKNRGQVYQIGYQENEEYQKFIDVLTEASDEKTGIHPQKEDHILTLSTCTGDGNYAERFVVIAVCVDEQSMSRTE